MATAAQPFASINGERITSGAVMVPYYGQWSAHVTIASQDTVPSAGASATVSLGQLSFVGTVYRSSPFGGARSILVVGGHGGWRSIVPARSYHVSSGVSLSLVLNDLASDCGEKVNIPQDSTLSPDYMRPAGPAIETLRDLAGSIWWMGLDGTTQIVTRPSTTIASQYDVITLDGGSGLVEVSTESMQDWLPGNLFDGPTVPSPQTIGYSRFVVDNTGKLRVFVMTAGALDV